MNPSIENAMSKKRPAFSFVLEELDSLSPILKPMFGAHLVYIGGKMMLFLRDLETEPEQNGVWVATTPEGLGGGVSAGHKRLPTLIIP
jgi:hypothetical protein